MGNPLHSRDYNRSIPFDELHPLLAAAQPHLVSLQKGSTTATLSNAGIFDADKWLKDYTDTVGLIAELDLVITVDTGVAHIAGAMGKPVWNALSFTPDWRWMLGREDSPWYPTIRLFRQTSPRAWGPLIKRMSPDLKKFIAGDKSVLLPPMWDGKILRQNPNALTLPDMEPVRRSS